MSASDLTEPAEAPLRVEVTCIDTYYADLRHRYSYTFQIAGTDSRFRVYDRHAYRFDIGGTYHLHLAEQGNPPLLLPAEDVEFLRTTMHNAAGRWREAIAEADAGAHRPPTPPADTPPGFLDVEPTPAGYRAAAGLFREELERVEHLIAVLDAHLAARYGHADSDRADGAGLDGAGAVQPA